MKGRVLVVEDEPLLRESLAEAFRNAGYATIEADTLAAARKRLAEEAPDVVLSDVRLPDGDGTSLLDVAGEHAETPLLLMTAYAGVEAAVEAMRRGAFTYLPKPVRPREVLVWIERALDARRARRADAAAPEEDGFLGESALAKEVRAFVETVSPTPATVLLLGETGVGKDLLARKIHRASGRKGRFVAVNTPGLPATLLEAELFGHERGAFTGADRRRIGLVEAAEGGTLFLDEVAELPLEMQPRLLRLLDAGRMRRLGAQFEKEVDVRFVAATNRDLAGEVRAGRFREDLYYRLSQMVLSVPPLRARREDIPLLAERFAERAARRFGRPFRGFSDGARAALVEYDWPGNVRELAAVVERSLLLSPTGRVDVVRLDLAPHAARPTDADAGRGAGVVPIPNEDLSYQEAKARVLADFDRAFLGRALEAAGGNVSEAARRLGMDRKHLADKLRELEVIA